MEKTLWCWIVVWTTGVRLGESAFSDYDVRTLTTTDESYRQARWRHVEDGASESARAAHDDHEVLYQDEEAVLPDDHDYRDTKAMVEPKVDYWGGYYDFLINEGSYKFWAVFQLATAALLIYSGFAALYYAKVNPMISDEEDDFLAKRRKRSLDRDKPPREREFFGFDAQSLQRILDAVAGDVHR
ncbi:uncharacterized protein LOC106639116 [Copidosoma floridanum]|uniref:uncharacterized protein LOC106639116 n=1 Tax=Copidosoma floridanum TaxID=29053 RepID=UPI0006C94CD7|nr:uncharacterized protein LOC106639116 [Copidosoma floridanum]